MRYIREYKDFLLELRTVLSSSSSSGRTRHIDSIWDDPEDAKSPSSSILLKNKLKEEEFKSMVRAIGKGLPKEIILDMIRKSGSNKYLKLMVTLNNLNFLKDKAKEGELRCEYCNKGPLVIYDICPEEITMDKVNDPSYRYNTKFNPRDGATCDHKQPQSKGGDKFDYSNLAVCCSKCNKEKDDMSYENWMIRVKQKNAKNGN